MTRALPPLQSSIQPCDNILQVKAPEEGLPLLLRHLLRPSDARAPQIHGLLLVLDRGELRLIRMGH